MCDTMVVLPSASADGKVYFAKNSDREPNEAQYLEIIQGSQHEPGEKVDCTYISIPQVKSTYTVLLSKPFWMWGAEMGVNEHGVAIGNEALFTKIKTSKDPGLIGMDLLRLALERSKSAEEAIKTLIQLINQYGQNGNCSFGHQLFYHNSFLIADRKEAWVLETADKHWVALKVKDFYSISNGITIENEWDMASEHLVNFAIENNWCRSRKDFSFKKCYSDFIYTNFSQSQKRRCDSYSYLEKNAGKIDVTQLMHLLRLHHPDGRSWRPDRSFTEWTVCLHKGFGPIRASQTTGSLISRLSEDGDLHFVTGTSAPCTSIFKPVWIDTQLPSSNEPIPTNQFNSNTLWWRHERVHREVLKNFENSIKLIDEKRKERERDLMNRSLAANGKSIAIRQAIVDDGFSTSNSLDEIILEKIMKLSKKDVGFFHNIEWQNHNQKAGL